MANEKLISTVKYNGQSVGSVDLTIQDTSFYPTYSFKLLELFENKEIGFNYLQQLCEYKLIFSQDRVNVDIKFIYAKLKTTDGKLVSRSDAVTGSPTETFLTLNVDATGKGFTLINTNYFPSFIGYTGEISFYHDPDCLLLIQTLNLSVLPVTSGSLEIIPSRNVTPNGDLSYYPPFVEMGEDFYIRASYNGPSVIGGNRASWFNGKISTLPFTSNGWISNPAQTTLSIFKENNIPGNPATGLLKYTTLLNPTDKNKQNMLVTMGEARTLNSLRYPSYIDAFAWINTNLKTIKLYRRLAVSDTNSRCVVFGQGTSLGNTTEFQLGPIVITKASDWDEAYIGSYIPVKGANNPTLYNQSYLGEMSAITWDSALLTTRETRRQFGKYQKSFVKTVNAADANTIKVNWASLSDQISDVDYGVPTSFSSSDLVILVQLHNRADVCNIQFNTTNTLEFSIRTLVYSATGVQETYNGLVSILVVRKSEQLNTYPEWIPYPRIFKADRALPTTVNGEKAWVITIPETASVDLSEDRYVVQYTHEQTEVNGGNVTLAWRDNRVKKEKSKITIFGSSTNTNVDPKHYVIWDLGPDLSFNDPTEGRLRGEIKPITTSPWVTENLSGSVNADSTNVVTLPTIGDSNQFYQSSLIWRTVTSEPKKFTVWARNTDLSLYQGNFGLLVWDTGEITNADRRNQFGRYQNSMLVSYDTSTGPVTFDLNQINDDVASASWGLLNSLKDPTLMMFFNTEEYSVKNSVYWGEENIQLGINYTQGPNFVGKVSVLFLRVSDWVIYPQSAKYPRILYSNIVDVGLANSYTLPINKTYLPNPLDKRYQLIAQLKPKNQFNSWFDFGWTKLTRNVDDWTIDITGNNSDKLLQVAIVDYGPGPYMFGKYDTVANITDYTFQDPIPNGGSVIDQNYSLAPVISASTNTGGSSSWWAEGLTRRSVIRQDSNNTLTVRVEGYQDSTYGGTRNSARGYVGWDSVKNIGSNLLKQIPNLVGRNSTTVSSNGFDLSAIANDISSSGKAITNFNDPDLVFVTVPEFGDVRFSFKRLADGSGIRFINSSTGQAYSLLDGKVNTLILKETKTMPVFATDAAYPRVIYSAKSVPLNDGTGLYRHLIDLTDSSYAGVNLKTGRYQILFGCEIGNTAGDVFLLMEANEGNLPEATERQWYFYIGTKLNDNFGYQARVNVAIIDYGPIVSGDHGEAYVITTERLAAAFFHYILASRNAITVIKEASKVYGSIRRGWSYFGNYFALFNRVWVVNKDGGSGLIDLDFTTSDSSILDTTSIKPSVIYLSINNGPKLKMNRETSRDVKGSYQRYYVISNDYSTMYNIMNAGLAAENTYLITLV